MANNILKIKNIHNFVCINKNKKEVYLIVIIKLSQFYKINFGYTQVLFMGSVPRINCLLAIVPSSKKKVNDYIQQSNHFSK